MSAQYNTDKTWIWHIRLKLFG